jgi:hypothetical protein
MKDAVFEALGQPLRNTDPTLSARDASRLQLSLDCPSGHCELIHSALGADSLKQTGSPPTIRSE